MIKGSCTELSNSLIPEESRSIFIVDAFNEPLTFSSSDRMLEKGQTSHRVINKKQVLFKDDISLLMQNLKESSTILASKTLIAREN